MTPITAFPGLRLFAAKSPVTLVHKATGFSDRVVLPVCVTFLTLLTIAAIAPTSSAQTVSYAGTGAVNFGTANVCPSGKTTPAPCSQTMTLTYNVTASGTLGTPQALTTGQPNVDYKLASGSTCTGSVIEGSSCAVKVTFAPVAPGARNGAVEIVDGSGNVLATTYIYGNGVGPLLGFNSPTQGNWRFNSYDIQDVAVDPAGNVFMAYNDSDNGDYMIQEALAIDGLLPQQPVVNILASGKNAPYTDGANSLAVDGAGNVFFTGSTARVGPGYVKEILAAGGYATTVTISSVISNPGPLRLDGSGNIFVIADSTTVEEILAAGGYTTIKTLGSGFAFTEADGLALDSGGNVFVADRYAADGNFIGTVEEIPAAGDYATTREIHVSSSNYGYIGGIAVDAAGNLFVGFVERASVAEFLAVDGALSANPAAIYFGTGFLNPAGIVLDGHGNVFMADLGSDLLEGLLFSSAMPLEFNTTSVGSPSGDSPRSMQIQNHGNAGLDLTGLSVSLNWEQVPGSGTPPDCTASYSLVPSALCNLSITFLPAETGALTGSVTLVDNSLNAAGTSQRVSLGGTAITGAPPPHIASLSQDYGAPGAPVVLMGTGFGSTQGASTVTLSGMYVTPSSWSDTSIRMTVPATATSGNILVTVDSEVSNAVAFTLEPTPSFADLWPLQGPPGTVVTISGQNLNDAEAHARVILDGKSLPILSDSSTAIQVTVPAGAVTGSFYVVVNGIGFTTPSFGVTIQPPTYAGTGAVNFGSANVCPSGQTTPAPCSKTLALTFNISESGTLGSPKALSAGASNLDFTVASGSTCFGSVTKGNTCTVNVTFAPLVPGTLPGAVELFDSSGTLLTTTYIHGSAVGPLIGYVSTPLSLTSSLDADPVGIATDASGDVFLPVSSVYASALEVLWGVDGVLPAHPTPVYLPIGGPDFFPVGAAVDGAGNLFLTNYDPAPPTILELSAGSGYKSYRTVSSNFSSLGAITVDGSGNLFVVDFGSYSPYLPPTIKEVIASTGYSTINTLAGGFAFGYPSGLAEDSSGNIYVADSSIVDGAYQGAVEEILAAGGYTSVKTIHVSNAKHQNPSSIAVDPAGNLFVTLHDYVAEVLAVDGVVPSNPVVLYLNNDLGMNANVPGIALDRHGNILTLNGYAEQDDEFVGGGLQQLQFSTPLPLNFATTVVGNTSSDSPQSILVQNSGNANLNVTALTISHNWDQVPGSGTPEDCTASFSLGVGALCNLSISFKPTEAGALTGATTVVDNSLNAPGSTQSGTLSGTATSAALHIASLNQTYASPYSVVILYGTNFGATQGSSTVTFGGIATPHYNWSDTKIYVTVPPNATTGNLVVTVNGQTSNPVAFTVLPQAAVTGISPTSGPVGTLVTISGKNLVDYENKGTVTLNGESLPILSETSTAIQVAIPTGAVSEYFHILINDTGINTPTFTVTK
jgi:sugar lactone lactonase YvrE